MLNLTRLRIFFEVARHQSFGRAAEELSYTPSAVSHQIATLERELQTRLINRAVRPWTLTTAGESLFRRAASALSEVAAAEHDLAELASGTRGSLRLSSVASGLRSVVPPAVAAFKARYPDVELRLAEEQPASILRRLRNGELDVGVIVTAGRQAPPSTPSLKVATLIEQTLMVAVPASSGFARMPHLNLRQLGEESWLLPTHDRVPEFRTELDLLFEDAGYTPKVMLEVDDEVAGGALVASGLGLALIPGLAAPAPLPGVTHVPLRPKRLRALHVVANAGVGDPVDQLFSELELAAVRLRAPSGS
jgi:DNA-binding transcriptional LysR family regulator